MLVYEPEAAALYCRFQKMHNISNAKDDSNLSKKKKMLVFDMGGKGPITLTFKCQHLSNCDNKDKLYKCVQIKSIQICLLCYFLVKY